MTITMPTQAKLQAMSNEQLQTGFNNALKFTAESIRVAAAYWVELQSRGVDVSDTGIPWASHFPAIASGRLDPNMILAYGWNDAVLAIVSDLVPEEQAKIANPNEKIPLLVPDESGTDFKTIMRAPKVMKASEFRQVFGDGRIRTPDEQRKYATPLISRPSPSAKAEETDNVEESHADLDLFNALTPVQRDQVRRYAASRRPPVAFVDLVVRWAVQRGACKETPSPSRARRRAVVPGDEARPG
jgi:hypothetical protein